jgi:hypothetical protein
MNHINAAISDVATEFATQFIAQRRAAIQKKTTASGKLAESFEFEIEKQAQREGIAIAIAFLDAGRLVDMKPRAFSGFGEEAVKAMEVWLENKDLDKFIAAYRQKHELPDYIKYPEHDTLSREKIKTRIAWGILKTRQKGKWRRKSVWNKPKSAAITDLITQILVKVPVAVSDDLLPIMPKNN